MRPFVFVNMAMTADGKIATANRAVSTFGSPKDLEHLYELRATADAVMNGARTIEANKVTMGTGGKRFRELRRRNGLSEAPLRIIVSGSGSIDRESPIFKHHVSPLLLLVTRRVSKRDLRQLRTLADDVLVAGKEAINWKRALRWLRTRWNVRRLVCEGGAALNASLLEADLIDEIHLTLCPKIAGGRRASTLADGQDRLRLADARRFRLASIQQIGKELFLIYRRARTHTAAL